MHMVIISYRSLFYPCIFRNTEIYIKLQEKKKQNSVINNYNIEAAVTDLNKHPPAKLYYDL